MTMTPGDGRCSDGLCTRKVSASVHFLDGRRLPYCDKCAKRIGGQQARIYPTCTTTGKTRYRDAEAAEHALAHLLIHGPAWHLPRRAYPCPDCGGWHLTSQERWP
jgi:hypothetical protein